MGLLFSSLWVTHLAGMGFDMVVSAPLLPPHCDFFFVFGLEVSFLVGSSIILLIADQQLAAISVLLQEEMSICPSTLPP